MAEVGFHDADLDVEALYAIHAVRHEGDPERVGWLHTHGLEEIGAIDIDILDPSRMLVANSNNVLRCLAFAALEGTIQPDTSRFTLAHPGGDVRLVPVARFHQEAAADHRRLREMQGHDGRRSVVCDPGGGWLGRWRARPMPSRFLSAVDDDNLVFPFTTAATMLMAVRAQTTLAVFERLRAEFESLRLPALVKLGYEVAGGGPTDREHLWFEVHAMTGDAVEATLLNAPHQVPGLTAGQRGTFGLERLSDWTILSPEGAMSPRNVGTARRLRETRSMWQARLDAERGGA